MVQCLLRLRWLLPAAELLILFACYGQTGAGAAALFEDISCGDCCTVKRPAAYLVIPAVSEVLTQLQAA